MERSDNAVAALSQDTRSAWEESMFARFPPSAARLLLSEAREVTYAEEEILYAGVSQTGSPLLGLIIDGLVRTFMTTPDGRQATLRYLGHGSVLGIPASLDAGNDMVRAETRTPTRLLRIPAQRFRRVVQGDAGAAWEVTQYLLHQFSETERMLATNAFLPVGARIAIHLLDLAERDGSRLVVSASQQDIAAAAGSVREVVSRKLKQLQEAGVVARLEDRRIVLLDTAALHELARGVPPADLAELPT
jgi:CRP/FNR family transcriptional regulator, cyclic AMP receptor protein